MEIAVKQNAPLNRTANNLHYVLEIYLMICYNENIIIFLIKNGSSRPGESEAFEKTTQHSS